LILLFFVHSAFNSIGVDPTATAENNELLRKESWLHHAWME